MSIAAVTGILRSNTGRAGIGFIVGLAVLFGFRFLMDRQYNKGSKSRDAEIATLDDKLLSSETDNQTLRGNNAKLQADVNSLNSRLQAEADQHASALIKQSEQFAETQKVTSQAIAQAAKNNSNIEFDFADIFEQLEGVEYEYDQDTDSCVIRGGGRVLRNAAKGRIGN